MSETNSYLTLSDAPAIENLTFRLYAGDKDIAGMEKVYEAVTAVEGEVWMPRPDTKQDAALDPA